MKKIFKITIPVLLTLILLSPFSTFASSCQQIGNTTFCDDGTSYQQIGNTTFGSDGTSYQRIGSTTFGSNGTSYQNIGGTTFSSDGTSYQHIGNTTFGSDGSTYQRIGNTTFGSGGSGNVYNSCPENSSANSSGGCTCNYGYSVNSNKTSCVYNYSYTPTYSTNTSSASSCPYNSYLSGNYCYCNTGYQWNSNKTSCIIQPIKTENELCHDSFGINSYSSSTGQCSCNVGYEWATDNKSCVKSLVCGVNETKQNGKCVTADRACQNEYGKNSNSTNQQFDSKGSTDCGCKNGYTWNSSQKFCIVDKLAPVNTGSTTTSDSIQSNTTVKEPVKNITWYEKLFNWFK